MTDQTGSALAADCLDLISAASTVIKVATKAARWGLESKEPREGHPDFGKPNRVLLLEAFDNISRRSQPVADACLGSTERFNPDRVNVGELERKLTLYREQNGVAGLLSLLAEHTGYGATTLNEVKPAHWASLDGVLNERLGLTVDGEGKKDRPPPYEKPARGPSPPPVPKWTWAQVESGARSFSATYGSPLTSKAIVRARTAANLNIDAVHVGHGKLPSLREAPEAWDLFMTIIREHSVRAKEEDEDFD